jgi:dienelactone hydrolase
MKSHIGAILLAVTSSGIRIYAEPPLDRADLLSVREADGKIRVAATPVEWEPRRTEILNAMQSLMGRLPGAEKRCPLDVRVEEDIDCGDHVRRLLSYQSEPDGRTPAYLLVPKAALEKDARDFPAVLCLHPTNAQGYKSVVGLADAPNRGYALELARRGFVTIAPAYPLLADYNPDLKRLGYVSGTMKAIWDNIRALDLLDSLPFVRRSGYGAIGHSLGGHNAIYTAIFDARIKVIVSSCGFDSYLDYYSGNPAMWQKGKGWTQDRYIPRLADYAGRLQDIPFDFHGMIAALAPRRVFVNAPTGDSNFQWRSVDRVIAAAKKVYILHGVPERLQVEHPDCPHDFPPEMRERAYQVLDELRGPSRSSK